MVRYHLPSLMMMTYWELQRWDIHRIRRALKRAIEAEEEVMGDGDEAGTRQAKASREVALWHILDRRLELMLQRDHERRHGPPEEPEDPEDLLG